MGTNLPTFLFRDREPSRNKVRRFLQVEMVVQRARDLSPHHLQLIMVNELMWTLTEEKASDQAHQTHMKYKNSNQYPVWIKEESQCMAWDVDLWTAQWEPMCKLQLGLHQASHSHRLQHHWVLGHSPALPQVTLLGELVL